MMASFQPFIDQFAEVIKGLVAQTDMSESEGINLSAKNYDALYSEAYKNYQLKNYKKAMEILELLTICRPLEKRSWFALGACRQELKQYAMAQYAFMWVMALDNSDPTPFYHAAYCSLALDSLESAEDLLEKSIERSLCRDEYTDIHKKSLALQKVIQRKKI